MKKKFIYLIMIFVFLVLPSLAYGFVSIEPTPSIDDRLGNMGETILGVIQWSGFAIATGMIIYIGIKYTMAAANEKAELKQSLINYVIGALVIICAVTIATWCYQIFKGDVGGGGTQSPVGNPSNMWGISAGSASAGSPASRPINTNNIWGTSTGSASAGSSSSNIDNGTDATKNSTENNEDENAITENTEVEDEENKTDNGGLSNVLEAVGDVLTDENIKSDSGENGSGYGISGR